MGLCPPVHGRGCRNPGPGGGALEEGALVPGLLRGRCRERPCTSHGTRRIRVFSSGGGGCVTPSLPCFLWVEPIELPFVPLLNDYACPPRPPALPGIGQDGARGWGAGS